MEVSHIVIKKGGVDFWEGRRCLKWGYIILGRRMDSECRIDV